ncbi:hypothetical protein Lepto7376_0771 [[Leptolyngbya] sp. PCC 7376]|uniref:hypothetical protein n=1 Tax=[Leptolyngbya] sp. PCC 7376 TaxID=111781 RepID=UPI00029F0556|nr:hypothetical protein [[Leptolyngbya] sp. PCC 7376]AFY37168.1 hypothetical protein Lepto7376_0771 [[Leptolyngbya] sp. PCC 7376]
MPVKQSDFLAQNYISLESEESEQGDHLVYGVAFDLTQHSLPRLLEIKAVGRRLKFSRNFVLAWQQYALFQENSGVLQRAWSFTLTYESQGVLQTLVTRDGEIVNQICADILPHPVLYQQLREVHLWMMDQLLGKLGLRRPRGRWINAAAWSAAITLIVILALLNAGTVLSQPLLLLPLLLAIGILKWLFDKLLRHSLLQIQGLLVKQMLWGHLAGDRHKQQKGLRYLRRL